MKKKLITILIFLSLITCAYAKQIIIVVPCKDGVADISCLKSKLVDGWRVVSAVAVQDSNSISMIGRPKQSYTASIIYVLEKE